MTKKKMAELIEEYVSQMEFTGTNNDKESAHSDGDSLLCDFLREIGAGKLVEAYESFDKWYA